MRRIPALLNALIALVSAGSILAVAIVVLPVFEVEEGAGDSQISKVRYYYSHCVDAHWGLGKEHWENVVRAFGREPWRFDYAIDLLEASNSSLILVSASVSNVFPDAPYLQCLFDEESRNILSAAVGTEWRIETQFEAYEAFTGWPDENTDRLAGPRETQFPLSRVVDMRPPDQFTELVLGAGVRE